MGNPGSFRIGHGWDLHRLEPLHPANAKPLVLGGIPIPHDHAPVAHSDGDALLHAVTDALLGALAQPDIGQLFPDSAPENKGRDSRDFLAEAVRRVHAEGLSISNLDTTIILERPKLAPLREAIRDRLAMLLGIDRDRVNVKAKTHERVDAVGQGLAVEAHAVVLLIPQSR
jgi:2-C-methyl-D-erythritol 2,4-cyclodiphosphate synthase